MADDSRRREVARVQQGESDSRVGSRELQGGKKEHPHNKKNMKIQVEQSRQSIPPLQQRVGRKYEGSEGGKKGK